MIMIKLKKKKPKPEPDFIGIGLVPPETMKQWKRCFKKFDGKARNFIKELLDLWEGKK